MVVDAVSQRLEDRTTTDRGVPNVHGRGRLPEVPQANQRSKIVVTRVEQWVNQREI